MLILGSGLAGCIAAIVNPHALVFESGDKDLIRHKAVLRFKTDSISQATGIPFTKVKLQKSIWYKGKEVDPSPRMTALYSHKVTGGYSHRSITSLDEGTRFIAPPDFQERLRTIIGDRIRYNHQVQSISPTQIQFKGIGRYSFKPDTPIISTMPIHVLGKAIAKPVEATLRYSSIYINRMRIPDCDMYVSVYYPDPEIFAYRASITKDVLIIESNQPMGAMYAHQLDVIFDSLGLTIPPPDEQDSWEVLDTDFIQRIGKMVDMNEDERKHFIYNTTVNYNIYSLGRFATWRNIQLDDVMEDIYHIKRMINQDQYNLKLGKT